MNQYTAEQATEFLLATQKKLDETGYTISFKEMFLKTKPKSVNVVVGTALNMRPTIKHTAKTHREQQLGHARSIEDMYLIVKHYLPNATIFDVVKDLQKRKDKDELRSQFCHAHKRQMFYKDNSYYKKNEEDLSKYGII